MDEDKKVSCPLCDAGFPNNEEYIQHYTKAHPQGESATDLGFSNSGEGFASGSAPAPESDDNMLDNAQSMGQQLGEDEEHPQELNIAGDVDKAEEYHKSN